MFASLDASRRVCVNCAAHWLLPDGGLETVGLIVQVVICWGVSSAAEV
jgi:hypothetical protein